MILVVPRRTNQTPDYAIEGYPGLFRPEGSEVHISVVFTWDIPMAEKLKEAWSDFYPVVKVGGPAYNDPGEEFIPGRYVKEGYVFTSRGCPRKCDFCLVPVREGKIRELEVKEGNLIQDNNLLACSKSHIEKVFAMLSSQKGVVFSGGIEASRVNGWFVEKLRGISLKTIFLAFDSWDREKAFSRAMWRLRDFSIEQKRAFVLIGRDGIEEDIRRCVRAYELGALPFAQLYQPLGKKVEYSKEYKRVAKTFSRPAMTKAYIKNLMGGTKDDA